MNDQSVKLTEGEAASRRRLLLAIARGSTSEAEFIQSVVDIQVLVHVSDELIAEVSTAFHATANNEDDSVSSEPQQQHQRRRTTVVNPYEKNAFTKMRDSQKKVQQEQQKNKNKSNRSHGTNTNSSGGRPSGSTNQPGHNAGGDRRSEQYRLRKEGVPLNQPNMDSFLGGSGGGGGSGAEGGGDGGEGGGGHGNVDDEERKKRRKAREKAAMEDAIKQLQKYAESFKNGSIEMPIDDESDDEDDIDEGKKGASSCARRPTNPTSGSPIREYLDGIKQEVMVGKIQIGKGVTWIAPRADPASTSMGSTAKPNKFYTGNVWVFVWDPMLQFQHLMPTKHKCPCCKSTNTKHDGGWDYRPCHWWDMTAYVLHRHVFCNGCGSRYPTIRADAMATLPTLVAERFPFMLPHEYGPGLYIPMLLMMVALMPNSILCGAFAKTINRLKRIKYTATHVSYLDNVMEWQRQPPAGGVTCSIPQPFSPYYDQAGYGGIELKPSLMKKSLRLYMKTHGPFMQASFQCANDEGISSDDSHKFTRNIVATVCGKKVKPFTDTLTILSLNGKPCLSLFKPTKSRNELTEVIPMYHAVRKHAGHNELLRYEGDNAAGDSSLHVSASPSLLKDVVPYRDNSDLPRYEISLEDFRYIRSLDALETYALAVRNHVKSVIESAGTIRVGLDTEFDHEGVHIVALEFEGYRPACLVHLYDFEDKFDPTMKKLLELDGILIIGCNVAGDLHKLRDRFGIKFQRVRDNRQYCLHDNPAQKTGLSDLGKTYCHVHVDKSHQRDNFNVKPPLVDYLQRYAMGDAMISLRIDSGITSNLINADGDLSHPLELEPGTEVIIKIGGREAARANIVLIGGYGGDSGHECRLWGSLYIGSKKALVKITTVLVPGAKVPYQHRDWGHGKLSLEEAMDRSLDGVIAVNSKQIHKRLGAAPTEQQVINSSLQAAGAHAATSPTADEMATSIAAESSSPTANETSTFAGDGTIDNGMPTTTKGADDTPEWFVPESTARPNTTSSPSDAIEMFDASDLIHQDEVNNDDTIIRSREKSDIWHEFDNMAKILKKDCPAGPSIHQLVRTATLTINEVEEKKVQNILMSRGVDDFKEHFFFNKEYWYRRVRFPPRKGEMASAYLRGTILYLKNNDVLKEYVTPELVKFLIGWADRCRDGRYDDLPDVEMYRHDGYDSDGLELWLRRRGSKAENFHQKMHVAIGPCGIGVEMAHYLQVILAYQYLVNAGIRRCGEPDFGHTELQLEDRIQTRIMDIWGALLFTNRINVSEYSPLDFTAVGLGPLTFNEDYVERGEPADCLKGDLRFMAERMGLKYPIFPPSTKKELGMIKRFCGDCPKPKMEDIQNLCRQFKARANGIDVFPKVPSMIKPSIKRWKINEQTELLEQQIKDSYDEIYERFRNDKISMDSSGKETRSPKVTEQPPANDANAPRRLARPHVAPLSAHAQNKFVSPAGVTKNAQRCKWHPICKEIDCGGAIDSELCRVYGKNGTSDPPAQAKLRYRIREQTWNEVSKSRSCPWGCGKAVVCGGKKKSLCERYGDNGTHKNERPSEEELKRMKKEVRAQQRREHRAKN